MYKNRNFKQRVPSAEWAYQSEKAFIKMLVQLCNEFEFDENEDPIKEVLDHFYMMMYQINFFYKKIIDEIENSETGKWKGEIIHSRRC